MRARAPHTFLAAALGAAAACGGDAPQGPPPLAELPPLPPAREQADVPPGPERPLRAVTIAFTGEVRGEIDPCGCPTRPLGGFARREVLLDELRAEPGPLFHLDAGELLLRGVATERAEHRDARARVLLELSAEVGVDAWAPGPTDLLALGPDRLAALRRPPPVGASWLAPDGRPALPPARVVEREGVRLGVIGLALPPPASSGWTARDPVAAARAGLEALRKEALRKEALRREALGSAGELDLVVALGAVPSAAMRVAAEVPGIGLVLTGAGDDVDPPRRPPGGGALVVEVPDRGRYVEVVRLLLGSTAEQPVELRPSAALWRELRTLREQAANTGERTARLDELEARFRAEARGRNLADVASVPLGDDLERPGTAAEELAEAFKARVLEHAARRAEERPAARPAGYVSSGACVNCHTREFARWTFSKHARAWEALLLRRSERNPECIPCHSTGFGEPGGWGEPTEANVRKFKAVQCEACHGPMGGHPDDPQVRSRPVEEATCRRCHDDANDPDFDFTSALGRATCQEPGGG